MDDTIIDRFIKKGREENGHNIIFGIEDWENHYLSEDWATAGKLLAILFLRENEEFIINFINQEMGGEEYPLPEKEIYQLLSKTVMYHTMQKTKKTMEHNSKAIASLPSLLSSEKKESVAAIKEKAIKKAEVLLRYIPVIGTSDSDRLGHILVDFINNTDNYYNSNWGIPSATDTELKQHLKDVGVISKYIQKYLDHFKLNK